MADEELRALQRAAASGDPEAQARYRRALCRKNGHRWVHYKGGDHLCQVCRERQPGDPREFGAQTVFYPVPRVEGWRMLERGEESAAPPAPPAPEVDRGFDPFADLIEDFDH